jgi:hypothetical protein
MNDPSSPNALALLAALRGAEVDSAAVGHLKARVHSRLSASLLGLAPALTATELGASSASHAAPLGPSGVMRAVVTHKAIIAATLAPVFALGVLTGAAADRWVQHRVATQAPRIAISAPVVASPLTAPAVAKEPVVTPDDLARVQDNKPNASAFPSPAPSGSASSLAAERSLLDEARHALARGEPGAGLAPLDRHAARYPKGILTEEREALAVRVLAALGNAEAAKARVESFHRQFPNSLFTPAVDNAIEAISRRNGEGEPKP